jgi:hypothetical protein
VFDSFGHIPQTTVDYYLESDEQDINNAIKNEFRHNKDANANAQDASVPKACIRSGQDRPETHLVNESETNTGESGLNG